MKKLIILFSAVCFIAIGCQNDINPTETISSSKSQITIEQAKRTIEESGGTVDESLEGIKAFLTNAIYYGTYNTYSGYAGEDIGKIYDGKIYTVVGNEWKEIDINNVIGVDTNLGKLEMFGDGQGKKVFTFDGFGYWIYENGEQDIPTYFTKYGFAENYPGTWKSADGSGSITITDNKITFKLNGKSEYITGLHQLKGNILTIKGSAWDRNGIKIVFDDGKATWYRNGTKF